MWVVRRQGGLAAGLLFALLAAPAVAEPKAADIPPTMQVVLDCRKTADEHSRLACYDAAVANVASSLSKGDIVAVDRQQMTTVRRQAFGFSMSSLNIFQRGVKPEEINRVTLPVKSATRLPDGKWIVRFEDQTWRQIDTGDFAREPRPGAQATIRRAALGSFIMTIGGLGDVRVRREN